ncbi:MAG: ankyrin repeat domain-containing protein [Virgibacillus proomii]|jgi:uncharacterized protein
MKYKTVIIVLLNLIIFTACTSNNDSSKSNDKKVSDLNQAFIYSAEKGDTAKVTKLLQDGANINTTNEQGTTAVLAATYNNEINTVKVLIDQGADINIRDNNLNNVLLYASAEGLLDIVKLAIDAGADTSITNRFGGTALIPAAERGHVEVVKALLTRSEIDVNHINNLHWTALMEAIILSDGGKKHQEIVQLLIDHGADATIGDEDGITPLQHAEKRGFHEIAEILKQAEA